MTYYLSTCTAAKVRSLLCQNLDLDKYEVDYTNYFSNKKIVKQPIPCKPKKNINLNRANRRVVQLVSYKGYKDAEFDVQSALMQARRKLHW